MLDSNMSINENYFNLKKPEEYTKCLILIKENNIDNISLGGISKKFLKNHLQTFIEAICNNTKITKIELDFLVELNKSSEISNEHAIQLGKMLCDQPSIQQVILEGYGGFDSSKSFLAFWNTFIKNPRIKSLIFCSYQELDFFDGELLIFSRFASAIPLPFEEVFFLASDEAHSPNFIEMSDLIAYIMNNGKKLKKIEIREENDSSPRAPFNSNLPSFQEGISLLQEGLKKNLSIKSFSITCREEFAWMREQKIKNFAKFKNICIERNIFTNDFSIFQNLIVNVYSELYPHLQLPFQELSLTELAFLQAIKKLKINCTKLSVDILDFLLRFGPVWQKMLYEKIESFNALKEISPEIQQEAKKLMQDFSYIAKNVWGARVEIEKRNLLAEQEKSTLRQGISHTFFGEGSQPQPLSLALTLQDLPLSLPPNGNSPSPFGQ